MPWLSREAILRQIAANAIEPIDEKVPVEYDDGLQLPLGFWRAGRHYEIVNVVGVYREQPGGPATLHLVRAGDQVYALCVGASGTLREWRLSFRVREAGEETVLVDFQLKRIADFHGHLCPELVIGYRACRCALSRLKLELLTAPGLRITAENTSSAVDAIQQMTGCTTGNGRLAARDDGKHVYTFVNGEGEGLRLALRPSVMLLDAEFLALEETIQARQATLWEVGRYQALLDERVLGLLHLDESALFDIRPASAGWEDERITSALAPCARCGELTAPTHLVVIERQYVCLACAKRWPVGPA